MAQNADLSRGRFQTGEFILKGEGQEAYEPRFTYHGFRYVQITGLSEKPTLDSLTGPMGPHRSRTGRLVLLFQSSGQSHPRGDPPHAAQQPARNSHRLSPAREDRLDRGRLRDHGRGHSQLPDGHVLHEVAARHARRPGRERARVVHCPEPRLGKVGGRRLAFASSPIHGGGARSSARPGSSIATTATGESSRKPTRRW